MQNNWRRTSSAMPMARVICRRILRASSNEWYCGTEVNNSHPHITSHHSPPPSSHHPLPLPPLTIPSPPSPHSCLAASQSSQANMQCTTDLQERHLREERGKEGGRKGGRRERERGKDEGEREGGEQTEVEGHITGLSTTTTGQALFL